MTSVAGDCYPWPTFGTPAQAFPGKVTRSPAPKDHTFAMSWISSQGCIPQLKASCQYLFRPTAADPSYCNQDINLSYTRPSIH